MKKRLKPSIDCVNLACGTSFVSDHNWLNLDYSPAHPSVIRSSLLDKLPIDDDSTSLVYSSHFLEHISREKTPSFLQECYRILKNNGRIRLVLPDWENLCVEYLRSRAEKEHDKADFMILEMIDQCVRVYPGGLLGDYFEYLRMNSEAHPEMIEYVKVRCGEDLLSNSGSLDKIASQEEQVFRRISIAKKVVTNPASLVNRLLSKLTNFRIKFATTLLPKAFREQNVSYASVGERHAWMWDFYTLGQELEKAGFRNIKRLSFDKSQVIGFPLVPLDMTADGRPRKGEGSMYIEAEK